MNWFRRLFADDTFRNGGDLTDTDGPFAGRDKVVHLVLVGVLWLLLWGFRVPPFPARILLTVTAVLGWECFELVRYALWDARGRPAPWPMACDRFSWRDCVAGFAGAACAELIILLGGSL